MIYKSEKKYIRLIMLNSAYFEKYGHVFYPVQ